MEFVNLHSQGVPQLKRSSHYPRPTQGECTVSEALTFMEKLTRQPVRSSWTVPQTGSHGSLPTTWFPYFTLNLLHSLSSFSPCLSHLNRSFYILYIAAIILVCFQLIAIPVHPSLVLSTNLILKKQNDFSLSENLGSSVDRKHSSVLWKPTMKCVLLLNQFRRGSIGYLFYLKRVFKTYLCYV